MEIFIVQTFFIPSSANAFTLREMTEILEKDSGSNAKECTKIAVQALVSLQSSSQSIRFDLSMQCKLFHSYASF